MEYIIDSTTSINATLEKMKDFDVLILKKGVYKEKVKVLNNNITIKGLDRDEVIIENKDFFHKIMPDFNECNTFRTYTVYVGGDNVVLKNLTIKNLSTPSSKYGQACALHVDGDYFYADSINIVSAQDTLFTGPLPRDLQKRHIGFLEDTFRRDRKSYQKYINCYIEGDVDFIFGGANATFKNCTIVSLYRAPLRDMTTISKEQPATYVEQAVQGFVCAPNTPKGESGLHFIDCNFITDRCPDGSVYLARPWRHDGAAVFENCTFGPHIHPDLFAGWKDVHTLEPTARFTSIRR